VGCNEETAGKVGIIVTEAAGNIIKHARNGQVVISPIRAADQRGLEILALDRGPGVADLPRCFEDGYSTAGTSGSGLGAIARLASAFDAHSATGVGTAVLARIWPASPPRSPLGEPMELGAVSLPYPGEEQCGDHWAMEEQPGRTLLMVADGLGHGILAAEAARAATRIFTANAHRRPAAILEAVHVAIRSTRGAAVAVAEINRDLREVRYAGVGNISGAIVTGENRGNLVSHNGIVGHQARKFQEFVYAWPDQALLVMHSDGLGTQWRVGDYRGLFGRDPSLIAGVLYRDFTRGRDDVTVVVACEPRGV
jgi:anti-sigma regulatory factor (Ser/Thr protein kinase)